MSKEQNGVVQFIVYFIDSSPEDLILTSNLLFISIARSQSDNLGRGQTAVPRQGN